jgi:NADH-quinone oxidoreductase subunit N
LDGTLKLVLPETCVAIAAMAVLLIDAAVDERRKTWLPYATLAALIVTALLLRLFRLDQHTVGFSGMFVQDGFALLFKWLFVAVGVLVTLVSCEYFRERTTSGGEYFALLLFSTVGMMLLVSAYDFIALFVGIELMSLATYILVGSAKKDLWSNEAAIKYLLLSLFASAILLAGISIVYAAVGTTQFAEIASRMGDAANRAHGAVTMALVLLVAGFGFKIAAVPFHMYVPDVYQGAPTPVTIFLAVGTKAAAFGGLVRVLLCTAHPMAEDWTILLGVLAVLTMTIGNVAAVLQTNVKRMLAYSSVAHAGYVLIGVAAVAKEDGSLGSFPGSIESVIFYLVAYAVMNVGAFSLLMYMKRGNGYGEELADFSGLGRRRPAVAVAMLIFLLSLAGIPPSIGFLGKLYIFAAAIHVGLYGLALVGVVNVVISLFYYARVVVHMFMREREREVSDVRSFPLDFVLAFAAAATVVVGIFPQAVLTAIGRSVSALVMGGIMQ